MSSSARASAATTANDRPSRDPRDTPAMRQYAGVKAQHPGCVVFFRMGDFYELFDDDAVLTSRVLGLTLTQRTTGVPMAGVPYHALENYLRRMIEQGYRVAVCDQIEDPKDARGLVDRAVTRVLTPGTLVDEALLDEASANLVAAIDDSRGGCDVALAIAEVSTGRFTLLDVPLAQLDDELARLAPNELLVIDGSESTAGSALAAPAAREKLGASAGCPLTARPAWTFRSAEARSLMREHWGVRTLEGFGLSDDDPALGAAGALLRYLLETQAPTGAARNGRPLAHLEPPRRGSSEHFVTIDAASLRSLEIERTMRSGGTEGSLLAVMRRCTTPMGKRLLRQWLCFPLRDLESIRERQRAVATLVADRTLAEALAERLRDVQDVARIVGRVALDRATPRDLVALGRSAATVADLARLLESVPAFARTRAGLVEIGSVLGPLAEAILARCVDDPPAHLREGKLFRDRVDETLDEARSLERDGAGWLAAYQKRLAAEHAIPSLKVGYNKVFGYYIEITHTHAGKVPAALSRTQTLKNAERYVTPELKSFEEKITTAHARAVERERELFDSLCGDVAAHGGDLSRFAEIVSTIDVLLSFAESAVRYGYVEPEIVETPTIDVRQGRHPVLDRTLGEGFVPNDCSLGAGTAAPGGGAATLALITGPNMAGKSTYIRQIAIIVLLAHTGSFVPAESARIGLVDRIFTRIGASDELHAGHSTFMVEMTETAHILHHATERSVVILDEIGRGTSTLDGLALAWAIAEAIAERGSLTLFATHYHELTDLAERLPNVANLHVAVREWGDEIVFLYRILPGSTDRSYGLHVAKLAGVPAATIERAEAVLRTLAVHTGAPAIPERPAPRPKSGRAPVGGEPHASPQMNLFAHDRNRAARPPSEPVS